MLADFSECRRYRYRLERLIRSPGGKVVGFCLHNPSTADHIVDDATTRRGIAFATAWGASKLIFVNVWAGVATRPKDLWSLDDPIGPENDLHLQNVAAEVRSSDGLMVVAWGTVSVPAKARAAAGKRLQLVEDLLRAEGCDLLALGVTLSGQPRHPLYLRQTTTPQPWNSRPR